MSQITRIATSLVLRLVVLVYKGTLFLALKASLNSYRYRQAGKAGE